MTIRRATGEDTAFVVSLTPSFVAFGLPGGRDPDAHAAVFARDLEEGLASGAEIFVAEQAGGPLGFINLEVRPDHGGRLRAYVADLAVAEAAQGRGVGRELMSFAEEWARERGLDRVALSVFSTNARARELYERLGFEPELITLSKPC